MSAYEIWVEGYRATGESATASSWGTYLAESFDAAVAVMLEEQPQLKEYYERKQRYGERNADGIMPLITVHQIWACRLFDNEADARKSCG